MILINEIITNQSSMNKILKEALIKEINELEKNYSKRDIEIIENLLKQVYKIQFCLYL